MFIEQGAQPPVVCRTEVPQQLMLGDRLFHQDRIDEHQAILQQLEAEGGDLLLLWLSWPRCPAAIAQKVTGFIPAFDDIQARFDFMAQLQEDNIHRDRWSFLTLPNLRQAL